MLSSSVLVAPGLEAHTSDVAARRDDTNTMHACMALPPDVYRVHAPEEDPAEAARAARKSGRKSWRRVFQRRLHRAESSLK
jgi:hypothetical protein